MRSHQPAAELLVLHAEFVQRLSRALAGSDGDDLAQDASVRVLGSAPPVRNARGWLAAMVGNLWRNRHRRDARRLAREQAAARDETVPGVDVIAEREEVRQRVVAAVLQLPEPLRAVVLLRFYEGLDASAIGARLQRPASTVRSQLASALERLRHRLDGEHGDRRAAWALPLAGWGKALTQTAAALRVAWPLRAAAATVALLAVAWLALPTMFAAPPSPPGNLPVPIADAGGAQSDAASEIASERQPVAVVAAAAVQGPETLWGTVVRDADSTPVADAVVELQHSDADQFQRIDADYAKQITTLATVHTDAAGHFTFAVARAQKHRLKVLAASAAPRVVFDCCGGAAIEVRVGPGAIVAGVVRAATTGEPIGGAAVTGDGDDGCFHAQVQTAADGSYRLHDVSGESILLHVVASGWRTVHKRILVSAGETCAQDLALERDRGLRGTVRDAVTLAGIGGAEVADRRDFAGSVRTRADGSYELNARADTVIQVRADGFATAASAQPAAEDADLDFALVHGATVRGRIVDAGGAPVATATVWCGMLSQPRGAKFTHQDWRRASVGPDGRFAVTAVPPVAQQLYVRAPGFGARIYALGEHGNDEQRELGDIVLRPSATLEGRLLDGARRPLVGVAVGLSGNNGDMTSAFAARGSRGALPPHVTGVDAKVFDARFLGRRAVFTASDGSFRFTDLPGGSYRFDVALDLNRQWITIQVVDGELRTGVDLVLDEDERIAGRVRADGVSLAGSLLIAQSEAGDVTSVAIAQDGTFELRARAGDVWCLVVDNLPSGYAMTPANRIRAPSRNLELVVQRALSITGRVVDAEGRGVAAGVFVWFADVPVPATHLAAADGSFAIDVPPDFVGKLTAKTVDPKLGKAAAERVAAGTRDLVLRLQ